MNQPITQARPSLMLRQHKQAVGQAVRRHGGARVRVFGSVARGTDQPGSDLDLLVQFTRGISLFDLVDLTDELEALLGVRVDVVSERGLTDRHAGILEDAVPL